MRLALGLLHLGTGIGYLLAVGLLPLWELVQRWRIQRRIELFGVALVAMAFTCGPHHLLLGWAFLTDRAVYRAGGAARYLFFCHLGTANGRPGCSGLDLISVIVAFPFAAVWTFLRLRAVLGAEWWDILLWRTPWWLRTLMVALPAYGLTMVGIAIVDYQHHPGSPWGVLVQVVLASLYFLIGYWLVTTQLATRRRKGYWSVSGMALAVIFPTCAISHLSFAYYRSVGSYHQRPTLSLIDFIGIGAATFFNIVVYRARGKAVAP